MIVNLQSLRAFAAINVVCFHIIGTAESYGKPTNLISGLDGWGANGVDIFFVISGFVMLLTQTQNKRGLVDFYRSRLIRIVPAYWFLTSVVVLLFFVAPGAFRETIVTPEWAFASYFFLSGMLGEIHPLVYVGWTLEWEMLFYLVFGLALLCGTWFASNLIVFLAMCAVALVSSNSIVLEFLAGMLVAHLYQKKIVTEKTGLIILLAGCALLLASLGETVKSLELDRFVLWGVPSFLIVLGAVSVRQIGSRLFTYLGDASYSVYLVQILSIPMFYKLISSLDLNINGDLLSIICLAFSVAAGVLMYAFFEQPATGFLTRKFVGRKSRPMSLVVKQPLLTTNAPLGRRDK